MSNCLSCLISLPVCTYLSNYLDVYLLLYSHYLSLFLSLYYLPIYLHRVTIDTKENAIIVITIIIPDEKNCTRGDIWVLLP